MIDFIHDLTILETGLGLFFLVAFHCGGDCCLTGSYFQVSLVVQFICKFDAPYCDFC